MVVILCVRFGSKIIERMIRYDLFYLIMCIEFVDDMYKIDLGMN